MARKPLCIFDRREGRAIDDLGSGRKEPLWDDHVVMSLRLRKNSLRCRNKVEEPQNAKLWVLAARSDYYIQCQPDKIHRQKQYFQVGRVPGVDPYQKPML